MSGALPQQEFINGFREGNFCMIRELYNQQFAELHTYVQQVINKETETTVIVTDTFIKLIQRRTNFDSMESIKAFLYITARNICLEYIRFAEQNNHTEQELKNNKAVQQDSGEEMTDAVTRQLNSLTEQMSSSSKKICRLLYAGNSTVTAIAEELNIAPEMVAQQKAAILRYFIRSANKIYTAGNLFLIYYLAVLLPAGSKMNV